MNRRKFLCGAAAIIAAAPIARIAAPLAPAPLGHSIGAASTLPRWGMNQRASYHWRSADIEVGQFVSGPGIREGTKVVAIARDGLLLEAPTGS